MNGTDGIFYMFLISTLMPLITELLITPLKTFFKEASPGWIEYFKTKQSSMNTVEISYTDMSSRYNSNLTTAVLMHLNKLEKYSSRMTASGLSAPCPATTQEAYKALFSCLSPANGADIECDGFNIAYTQLKKDITQHGSIKSENHYTLQIKSLKSTKEINDFINMCLDEWKQEFYPPGADPLPYYYEQGEPSKVSVLFSRYEISSVNTTFDDIFFPDKEQVISLLDKLENKEISKLGFLLHGAPGCGKSSCIKAIAHYTKKNIVSVKLSQMRSDADIMAVFHGSQLHYDDKVDYVKKKDRIFILEDIDAECDIVLKRPASASTSTSTSAAYESNDIIMYDTDTEIATVKSKCKSKFFDTGPTLSGLLNALDGIIELTGSIVIMTTNHVEKLDPALIRPGRITLSLELRPMARLEANKLIRKKYGSDLPELEDNLFTPAQLEALIHQSKDLSDLKTLIVQYQQRR